MSGAFAYLIAIVVFVIVLNFFMLFMRMKRDRKEKPSRLAILEQEASEHRHKEIQRRLDNEQEDLAYRVEMRNKMFDMYAQVRKNAAELENESGAGN